MAKREHSISGFEQNNNLIRGRFVTYLISYIVANLSNMLLTSIDSIIIGNYVGGDALAAINIFSPISLIISSIVTLLCGGIANYLPVILGKNDSDALDRALSAITILKKRIALLVTVFQIPVVFIVIKSYGLDTKMETMIWSYGAGIIITMPFYLYSMSACDELISIGKVKVFSAVSIFGAVLDIIFDYLLVAVCGFGVIGAGMCTGLCVLIQFLLIQYYVRRYTDLRKFKKTSYKEEAKEIITAGVPAFLMQLLTGTQGWVMTWCIAQALGMIGTASMSVVFFCNSIATALFSGIIAAYSPLLGMFYSAGNYNVMNRLMDMGRRLVVVLGIIEIVFINIFSEILFKLFGFDTVLDMQKQMLAIYSIYIAIQWLANATVQYFGSTLQNKLNSVLRVVPILIRIALAFALLHFVGGIAVMWAYTIPAVIFLAMGISVYAYQRLSGAHKRDKGSTDYMFISLKRNKGTILPEKIEEDLVERSVTKKVANKIALTIEELISITKQKSRLDTDIDICIVLDEEITLMMWDDGPPSELTSYLDSLPEDIFSAFLVRAISKDMSCSRVYDLNYVTVKL